MFNQKEYTKNYHKMKCKQIKLLLNNEKDKDVISYLESKTNVNGYLKALIRKDMSEMTLNELIEKTDLLETTLNVYRNGEKVEIDWYADNNFPIKRIYGGKAYELNVDLEDK